jgi:hypothetical protein
MIHASTTPPSPGCLLYCHLLCNRFFSLGLFFAQSKIQNKVVPKGQKDYRTSQKKKVWKVLGIG